MVSHPLTYLYHKNECNWEEILNEMISCGLVSHNASKSCGLHVHVNKDALTANQWVLVDWFVHREQKRWERIARRRNEHYASFKDAKPEDESLKSFYGKGYDRYSAINFCNRATVEFRLFRGTLKYSTFIATLALVDALVTWARTIHTHDILRNGLWTSFTEILKAHPKYDVAVAYLISINLMED
jgi:hypothetical protein